MTHPRRPGDPRADQPAGALAAVFGRGPPRRGGVDRGGPVGPRIGEAPPRRLGDADPRAAGDLDRLGRGRLQPRPPPLTMAHEIGHWICQVREGRGGHIHCRLEAARARGRGSDPGEREANVLAAALLMPEDAVRGVRRRRQRGRPAGMFGVSEPAMGWRLYNLGLIADPPARVGPPGVARAPRRGSRRRGRGSRRRRAGGSWRPAGAPGRGGARSAARTSSSGADVPGTAVRMGLPARPRGRPRRASPRVQPPRSATRRVQRLLQRGTPRQTRAAVRSPRARGSSSRPRARGLRPRRQQVDRPAQERAVERIGERHSTWPAARMRAATRTAGGRRPGARPVARRPARRAGPRPRRAAAAQPGAGAGPPSRGARAAVHQVAERRATPDARHRPDRRPATAASQRPRRPRSYSRWKRRAQVGEGRERGEGQAAGGDRVGVRGRRRPGRRGRVGAGISRRGCVPAAVGATSSSRSGTRPLRRRGSPAREPGASRSTSKRRSSGGPAPRRPTTARWRSARVAAT